MAGCAIGCYKHFLKNNYNHLKRLLQQQPVVFNNVRNNFMFKYLAKEKEHDTEYTYEISKDPEEWKYVEKLMPTETVPVPKPKPNYPSGWRPPREEALNEPYFVERSKNHMLSVYLTVQPRKLRKTTVVKRISGDLWRLHDELKAHIEEKEGRKIYSYVHEGNNMIHFKGDHVYYAEQWLLNKGF